MEDENNNSKQAWLYQVCNNPTNCVILSLVTATAFPINLRRISPTPG